MARSGLPVLFAILLWLGACSFIPSHPPSPDPGVSDTPLILQWQRHQAEMQTFTQWRLVGKIGIRTANETNSAHVNWEQQNDQFQINLTGPFGQGAAELSGNFESVLLKIAGHEDIQTDQPEVMLLERTGWDIPIKTLLHWIKGIPSPDQQATFELDTQGRLTQLTQANWQLEYTSYQQLESLWLPKKIQLHRNQIKLTLVIKGWAHPLIDNG